MNHIKRKKLFAIMLVVLCVCTLNYAQQIQKDVSVSLIVPSVVNASNYTKFVRITNNDDVQGFNDNLSVFVRITLLAEGKTDISEWNVSKIINSYSESGMGTLVLENDSNYILCVEIVGLNFADSNPENNFVCANITTKIFTDEINNDSDNNSEINNSNINNSNITSINTSINNSDFVGINNSYINNSNISEFNNSDSINSSANESIASNNSLLNESVQYENITNITNEENNNTEENQTHYNETVVNSTNNADFNSTDMCGCALRISANKEIFGDGEKLEFQIFDCGNSSKYTHPIEYWVEDNGGIVKQILNTTSKTTKSYTPSIDYGEKYFLIKSRIQGCENATQKIVVFVKEREQSELSEELQETFLQISDTSFNSGNKIIYARIEGYKGDSAKTLVSVWIEDDGRKRSEITKFYVNNKNSFFDFKVPILTTTEKSGEYYIVADGIGEKEEKRIYLDFPEEETVDEKEEAVTENQAKTVIKGKITSFYTRKKYYEENTTVYISVDFPEEKTLVVSGENQTIILENISEKNAVNISANSPDESIYAKLYFNEELLDSEELKLNLTANNEIEKNTEKNQTEIILEVYNSAGLATNNTLLSQNNTNKITGQVVSVEPNGKNFIFAFIAIVICFLLFSKKTRAFLFKKRGR